MTEYRRIVHREAIALRRTFWFHEDNANLRKFMIMALVGIWGVITIGIAFDLAVHTQTYGMLSALVWALVGRLWGGEAKALAESQSE